ncbi:MAG: hypothetical protein QF755_04680 [Candidatus Peribacteraceae bacterium]|jgi:hypothetical protein|nr:hypothetical protein [Candidatus Peribacteraceae bacterium]HCI04333.1 hypothetical protein [Candidatus Peribacteria bacterium]|tara:strand:- start:2874 stop:3581 length:708 start_codon:yes stop_codon:yes gene_type:complete
MKKIKINTRRRVIAASMIVVMSAPLAMNILATIQRNGEFGGTVGDISNMDSRIPNRAGAIKNRAMQRRQQREYWEAMKKYQYRIRDGEEGLTPPEINNYQSILFYLRDERVPVQPKEEVHGSAGEEGVSSLQIEELGEKERHLLRRYQRANNCPDTLVNYGLAGFYDLCKSVTKNPTTESRRGLLNPRQWMNRDKKSYVPTMKLRMQMLEQAKDRSNRKENTSPGRPTPYIKSAQ